MTRLHVSLNSAIILCRLFGLGLLDNYTVIAYFNDIFLLLINLVVAVFGYIRITYFVSSELQEIWNITAVVSVVRVYISIIVPPLLVFVAQFKKRTLTNIINQLDDLVPRIESNFIRLFKCYCVKWILIKVLTDIFGLIELHLKTHFDLFSVIDYFLIILYNIWLFIPIFQYIFIIKTVQFSVCEFNHRITSIDEWKICRHKWKELTYLAIHLTKNVVGDIIIIHLSSLIAHITFFIFTLYYYGYKNNSLFVSCSHFLNVLVTAFWMFEVFRQCENCKKEMLRTQTILNSITINTNSEYKELKYTSLFMLHTDFNFRPSDIFDMNYRNLITIQTLISAFVVFQIQMKITD